MIHFMQFRKVTHQCYKKHCVKKSSLIGFVVASTGPRRMSAFNQRGA